MGTRTLRVGLYCRISQDREGAGLGVKRQEEDCRALAASLGWRVVEIYSDNDVSAADRRKVRHRYQRMLLDIASGHIEAVISWHPDRLYRQPRELEDLIDLLEKHETEVRTVKAGTIDLSTPAGRMHARIHAAIAKHEIEHRQERIKAKVLELVRDGKIHNSGHRPFGFTRVYEGEGPRRKVIEDVVNEEEARFIREWARRALQGESLYSLVKDANERGIKTSTGGQWSYQGMRYMLMSGRIAGLKEHKRQVVGKAVWPAIITEAEHEDLRALLSNRAEQAKAKGAQREGTALKYPLSGLVRCTCGTKMRTRKAATKKRPDYACPPKGDGGCGRRVISLPDLEALMKRLVLARLEQIEVVDEADPNDPRPALEQKMAGWERRRAELEEELLDGDRPVREVREAIEKLNGRIAQARREAAEYGVKSRVSELNAAEVREQWDTYSVGRRQTVFRSLIERIVIHPAERPYNVFQPDRVEVVWR